MLKSKHRWSLVCLLGLFAAAGAWGCQSKGSPVAAKTPTRAPDAAQANVASPPNAPQNSKNGASAPAASPKAAPGGNKAPAATQKPAQNNAAAPIKANAKPVAEPGCAPWPGRKVEPRVPSDDLLPNGIASGGLRATSAKLWARTKEPAKVKFLYSAGPDCPVQSTGEVSTTASDDFTAHFPLTGLRPGTLYRYQAQVGAAKPSSPGWFVTAPAADGPDVPVKLAFSADVSGFADQLENIKILAKEGADFYISMGDWPYADLHEKPKHPNQFRRYYFQSRAGHNMEAMMRMVPVHPVWDDHEVINDWDGRQEKWNPKAVISGKKVWHEWWPIADAPKGEIYRKHRWGPGLEIFYLDTRSHRVSNNAPADGKTMLGLEQRRWLLESLSASTAPFKLVVTSVPLKFAITFKDSWMGFKQEQDIILGHIAKERISGVVFLAGDQHFYASHQYTEGMRQWQAGPLAFRTFSPLQRPPDEVIKQGEGRNYGVIKYTPGSPAKLTLEVHLERKGVVYTETLQAGVGQLDVQPPGAQWGWRIEGAHRFVGKGPRSIPIAPVGQYTISWVAPDGQISADAQTATLAADQTVVLRVK
mgnify:CR=1 FL=1